MKWLDEVNKKLARDLGNMAKDISAQLVDKAQKYYDTASMRVSGTDPFVKVYSTGVKHERTGWTFDIVAHGPQVAFIEFGTGKYNPSYTAGITANYLWDEHIALIRHGYYGKGHGMWKAWRLPPDISAAITPVPPDFKVESKKTGQQFVITYGIAPARAMYRAVNETFKRGHNLHYGKGI